MFGTTVIACEYFYATIGLIDRGQHNSLKLEPQNRPNFQPAFGCVQHQHLKAGKNTQQTFQSFQKVHMVLINNFFWLVVPNLFYTQEPLLANTLWEEQTVLLLIFYLHQVDGH